MKTCDNLPRKLSRSELLLRYFAAGAIATFPVPLLTGYDFVKILGLWSGLAAAILSWLLAATVMVAVWAFCNRQRTTDESRKQR